MKFLQGCIKYLIGCVNLWSQFQRKGGNSGYDSSKFAIGVNSGAALLKRDVLESELRPRNISILYLPFITENEKLLAMPCDKNGGVYVVFGPS